MTADYHAGAAIAIADCGARLDIEFTADGFDLESETAGGAIKNAWMCGLKSQQNLIIIYPARRLSRLVFFLQCLVDRPLHVAIVWDCTRQPLSLLLLFLHDRTPQFLDVDLAPVHRQAPRVHLGKNLLDHGLPLLPAEVQPRAGPRLAPGLARSCLLVALFLLSGDLELFNEEVLELGALIQDELQQLPELLGLLMADPQGVGKAYVSRDYSRACTRARRACFGCRT